MPHQRDVRTLALPSGDRNATRQWWFQPNSLPTGAGNSNSLDLRAALESPDPAWSLPLFALGVWADGWRIPAGSGNPKASGHWVRAYLSPRRCLP